MIEARRLRKEIAIPQGVEVQVGDTIVVKKGKMEVQRRLFAPMVNISKQNEHIILEPKKFSKREKKIINTFRAHLLNMIKGVQEPYTYKVKICSSHFPISAAVEGKELVVKNFLGEKIPRRAVIADGVDVKIEGDTITVVGPSKEAAGQTAANFELSTRITNRDRRVFQDGLWITEKGGKKL